MCHARGVGPPPLRIEGFVNTCVDFVDKALDASSEWARNAAALDMGEARDDGVRTNVELFARLVRNGMQPVR